MVYSSQDGFGLLNLTKINAQLKAKVIILTRNFVDVRIITEHFNGKNTTKPSKG